VIKAATAVIKAATAVAKAATAVAKAAAAKEATAAAKVMEAVVAADTTRAATEEAADPTAVAEAAATAAAEADAVAVEAATAAEEAASDQTALQSSSEIFHGLPKKRTLRISSPRTAKSSNSESWWTVRPVDPEEWDSASSPTSRLARQLLTV